MGAKESREAEEIEITREMTAAAMDAYYGLDERWHSAEEKFAAAIRAAIKLLRPSNGGASRTP